MVDANVHVETVLCVRLWTIAHTCETVSQLPQYLNTHFCQILHNKSRNYNSLFGTNISFQLYVFHYMQFGQPIHNTQPIKCTILCAKYLYILEIVNITTQRFPTCFRETESYNIP